MRVFSNETISSIRDKSVSFSNLFSESGIDGAIFRGLFNHLDLNELKQWIYTWGLKEKFSSNQKYKVGATKNHKKIVDKPLDDPRPTRFVLHQFFPWNTVDNCCAKNIFQDLVVIRNLLTGLPEGTGTEDISEYISWISCVHYRQGGDFIAPHVDDYAYQTILVLSELGKDFETGGQYYLTNGKHIYTEPNLRLGDIVVLKSNIPHGVHPIDPFYTLDSYSEKGRWMVFCPLVKSSDIEQ